MHLSPREQEKLLVVVAADLARRFCRLCETSGMAENFDALTGQGLRDRAFAWTSAVYLIFSDRLARTDQGPTQ